MAVAAASPVLERAPVTEVSATDGDVLRACIQCGACSSVCPLGDYMEDSPRRLIELLRAGRADEVLRGTSIWVCASCYACAVACPKEIPITELIYALKQTAIREGTVPKRFPTPVLAQEFVRGIDRWGRNTESRLAIRLYLRTRPLLLLRDGWLAQRLMRRGRMSLLRDSVRQRTQLRQVLRAVDADTESTR